MKLKKVSNIFTVSVQIKPTNTIKDGISNSLCRRWWINRFSKCLVSQQFNWSHRDQDRTSLINIAQWPLQGGADEPSLLKTNLRFCENAINFYPRGWRSMAFHNVPDKRSNDNPTLLRLCIPLISYSVGYLIETNSLWRIITYLPTNHLSL